MPRLTVIDTPGFGNNLVEEERTIESLVRVLRDEIQYVHAFVICFKQQDNRMTHSLRSMIGLMQKMFGDHFWENAILEATHWNYHEKSVEMRRSSKPPILENWWTDTFNNLFAREYNLKFKLPSVFIDTYYDKDNDFGILAEAILHALTPRECPLPDPGDGAGGGAKLPTSRKPTRSRRAAHTTSTRPSTTWCSPGSSVNSSG